MAQLHKLKATDAGNVRRLFEYHQGDEINSAPARVFVALVGVVERQLVSEFATIAEQNVQPDCACKW